MAFQLNGGFPIILADCPWEYDNPQDFNPARGGTPYKQMNVKDICALGPLVQKVAAKDCILFHWATYPKLREAIAVMEAWGFTYTTVAFTWVKLNPTGSVWQPKETHVVMTTDNEQGTTIAPSDFLLKGGLKSGQGYYTNANAEICLLGRRGRTADMRVCKKVKQIVFGPDDSTIEPYEIEVEVGPSEVIVAPVGRHSAKPEEVRRRIMELTGNLPGLELFARPPKVKGWKKLGYEMDGKDITDALEALING